jgi:hypothetical protein
MGSLGNKMTENIAERIAEVFWVAVKAAVVATIILLLLRVLPITVEHHGIVQVGQRFGGVWSVGLAD